MMPFSAMPTDATKMMTCPDQETLADYLGGWTDGEQSYALESHLEHCQTCQATISRIESEPDSILESVKSTPSEPANAEHVEPAVEYALSMVKRLPEAREAENEDGVVHESSHDSWGDLTERMIGPYQLIRSLGQGGMGSVYLARHSQLEKLVAIKVLPSRWLTSDLHLSRFQREIRAAGGLNHPAIVTATDAGQQAEIYYLVMEYVQGFDLSRVARLCGPLSIADACEAMRRIALGLSHAHSLGIVHRDVKPSNLMLSHSGEVKILDFGLARHNLWDEASAELTTVGQLMGTLDYMAPEQAECAAAVDYRADLYALGATLFRLLVGRPPLAASPDLSPLAKLKLLASHTSPRADTLRPDLPKELANFIAQLLHRDPARRPASAAHVAEKLEEFTAGNDLAALAHRAEQTQPHTPHDERSANSAKRGTPTATNASGGGTRRWGTSIALAGFSAFLLATIWLIVETQKGQLVIESEAENVTVKLLSDGKQYDSVKVQPGATATKLFAGKYEIEIAGASDDLLIDRESVIIRRGETVLAKIGRPQSTISLPAESSQITTEPVFEGKPLSVWLNQVETERSPTQLYSALRAVANLVTPSNAEQVRSSLLNTMATVANKHIRVGERSNSSLDAQIMKVIHDSFADPTRFWASMTVVLNSSDNALAQRLYPELSGYASTPATPLVRYLAEDYFPTATDEETILAAANFARVYLLQHSDTPNEINQQLATTLYTNERLGFDFWLEFLPAKNFYGYNQVMQQKAIEILAMEPSSTTDALLTQATIVLTELEKQSNPARIALTEQDQQRVLKAVAKHLERLSQQPSEIVKLCDLNSGFSDYSLPQQFMLPFFQYDRVPQTVRRRQTENSGSLALELLELTSTLGQHTDTDAAVEAMLASTRSQTIQVATKLHLGKELDFVKDEFLPQVRPIRVSVTWPELDVELYTGPASPRSRGVRADLSALQPPDMLAYMIHAAAYLALSDAAQERAKREFIIEFARIITEDFFATGDQNGDTMLSENESPLSEAEFQKADIDNDGQLSRDEIRVLVEASILDSIDGQQAQQSKIEPRFRYFAQRIITESDKNGNGVLERDEVKDNASISAAADANNDGKLTLEELAAWLQASEQSR